MFLALLVALAAAPTDDAIIVTAERRPSARLDAPLSISVINAEEIVRIGADHPAELLNSQPGVFIHRGNGQEHLTAIRSPVLTSGAGAGSFLYLEDNVPLRAAGFSNVNGLFEANYETAGRIEVVRGPSGAVYGANAIHGVINVLTRAPGEDREFLAEASVDTIGRIKSRGYFSDSNGRQGFLAAFSVLDDPGFRADSSADEQKFTLRHDYAGDSVDIRTIAAGYNLNQETAGFIEGPSAYRDRALRRTNPNPNSFRDARGVRLSSRIDIDAGDGVTLALTPYARWNEMTFRLHFFPSQAVESNSHWSVGFQSAAHIDRGAIGATIGVDTEYTEGDLVEDQALPTVFSYTQGLHYDYNVASAQVAPFAIFDADLGSRLKARAAVRVEHMRYDYDNRTLSGAVGRFLRPDDRIDRFTTVSPKFSLVYDLGDTALRASYARGARPPQTTDLYRLQINQTIDPAKPETIDAFELGAHGKLSSVSFDIAGYYMLKRHFFFRDADGYNVNDGRTRHLGGEAEISAPLGAGFSVNGNVSYGRHTYRFARPVLSLPQASEAIAFGDFVDTAPKWLAGASLSYDADWAPLLADLSWRRAGRYYMDAANSVVYPGHDVVDFRADLEISRRITGFFAVRNIFDTLYAERADFAFGSERYFPGEGRVATIGLRIEQ